MTDRQRKLLLFGGSGQIGQSIAGKFREKGWEVIIVSRSEKSNSAHEIQWDVDVEKENVVPPALHNFGLFDSVCWAQGVNLNDSIYSFEFGAHKKVYEANVVFILASLSALLAANLLSKPARFCVVSSIWQNISRQNKLSYAISKSALQGLVLSLANDMAVDGHLVNAVLPGALDTPMTHSNLSGTQIESIKESTNFKRLAKLEDVAGAAYFLCSDENTGVTGQFIKIDLGFSDVRNI
jgi:NAD(P)-dependent dehydrogenase (short-subunit alcohol dehydrogenase family)